VTSAVTAFDTTYATDSAVLGSVAHTYAVRFTERELRELIAYERMRPEIERAVSGASESVVTSHRAQLNDMVRNAVGAVTGSTPAPIAPGPLVSVTARPPFLPGNTADLMQPTSAARTGRPPPCADTGRAPAAAFRGPPFGVPEAGSSGVILLGAGLGAPTVEALVPVAYPPVLQASGIQGTVTVRYWVNPAGCAEPESIQVKQASDSAMAVAVRDAVRRMRFIERGASGETLWTSVDQVFTFRITP
jgi:TonB family protein